MFPVTDANLCANSLVEHVVSQYDLGAVRRCRLHQRGLNDTYKVESSQDHTYFLRIYRAKLAAATRLIPKSQSCYISRNIK
jgi:Ser/Thr protein kinase RdoA (MazF antagonist)